MPSIRAKLGSEWYNMGCQGRMQPLSLSLSLSLTLSPPPLQSVFPSFPPTLFLSPWTHTISLFPYFPSSGHTSTTTLGEAENIPSTLKYCMSWCSNNGKVWQEMRGKRDGKQRSPAGFKPGTLCSMVGTLIPVCWCNLTIFIEVLYIFQVLILTFVFPFHVVLYFYHTTI